jgi:C1A family cysteine protease
MRKYGWVKNREDSRDFVYAVDKPVDLTVPVDITASMPPVWDQGEFSSCTAHGTGCAVWVALSGEKKVFNMPSRMFVWYQARKLEGTTAKDCGAQVRDAIKGVVNYGCPEESMWDYKPEHVSLEPLATIYTDASLHKVVTYRAVAQQLNDIVTALSEGYPVVFGFLVDPYFETPAMEQTGFLPYPQNIYTTAWLGGHCCVLVAFDPVRQAFKVRNSWGSGWCENGYFWMAASYILDSRICSDLWILENVN